MLDANTLIQATGYIGIFSVVFAESGLFFGFFLPGDSLLFTAGFLASQKILSLPILLFGIFIFAVLGDSVGYFMGQKYGLRLFKRPKSFFFNPENIEITKSFFEKHGKKSIILARFIPVVRTFTPIFAGVGSMPYKIFFLYNVVGAFFWTFSLVLMGYFFGKIVPNAEKYLEPIILLIIFISIAPGIVTFFKHEDNRKKVKIKMIEIKKMLIK